MGRRRRRRRRRPPATTERGCARNHAYMLTRTRWRHTAGRRPVCTSLTRVGNGHKPAGFCQPKPVPANMKPAREETRDPSRAQVFAQTRARSGHGRPTGDPCPIIVGSPPRYGSRTFTESQESQAICPYIISSKQKRLACK